LYQENRPRAKNWRRYRKYPSEWVSFYVFNPLKQFSIIEIERRQNMTANETLDLISKQWCDLNDLMRLAQVGRNSALKVKKEIKTKLTNQGYRLPNHLVPMKEVVDYLDININYLESRITNVERSR